MSKASYIRLLLLLAILFASAPPATALCIGCGCQRAYRACLENDYPPNDLSLQGHCQNDVDCCRINRNICHGVGITFQLSAVSRAELELVSQTLAEFVSAEAAELGRSAGQLEESVANNDYEQRQLHTAVANAIAPLLSSEEGRRVEEALADFEAPLGDWLDRDNPSGVGDFETLADFVVAGMACSFPVGIDCQTLDGIDWRDTGEKVTCADHLGLTCVNAEQPRGVVCSDYRVRFRC